MILLCMLMLTGCGAGLLQVKPPVSLVPVPRPPITDPEGKVTEPGRQWLESLVNAYRYNCFALKVLRSEDPARCDEGLR